jgi:hypothetical protein
MIGAINTYFAFKCKGNGWFTSGAEKDGVIAYLKQEAEKAKLSISVVPGVIWLGRGEKKLTIHGPIMPKLKTPR